MSVPGGMAHGSDKKSVSGRDLKECTVRISVDSIKEFDVGNAIQDIESKTGKMSINAFIPRGNDTFEITFDNRDRLQCLSSGISINGKQYQATPISNEYVVVSIMYLPVYITDDDIVSALSSKGVEVCSPVKRHTYKGTSVADGTRLVKVKFPPNMVSLPYVMSFDTLEGKRYFRVVHNNQVYVCGKCFSPDHGTKTCPEIECYRCREFGHMKSDCKTVKCIGCLKFPQMCLCEDLVDNDEISSDDKVENQTIRGEPKETDDADDDGFEDRREEEAILWASGISKRDESMSSDVSDDDEEDLTSENESLVGVESSMEIQNQVMSSENKETTEIPESDKSVINGNEKCESASVNDIADVECVMENQSVQLEDSKDEKMKTDNKKKAKPMKRRRRLVTKPNISNIKQNGDKIKKPKK